MDKPTTSTFNIATYIGILEKKEELQEHARNSKWGLQMLSLLFWSQC